MALRMVRLDRTVLNQDVHFRWSSILSGAFITLGFGTFFLLIGNAFGLSMYNAVASGVGGAVKFWSWLYNVVTLVLAYGLGASISTRSRDILAGGIHGVVSWSVATFVGGFALAFLSGTARGIFQGTGTNSGNWLAAAIVFLGLFAAMSGGEANTRIYKAEFSEETVPPVGERRTIDRRTGIA